MFLVKLNPARRCPNLPPLRKRSSESGRAVFSPGEWEEEVSNKKCNIRKQFS